MGETNITSSLKWHILYTNAVYICINYILWHAILISLTAFYKFVTAA